MAPKTYAQYTEVIALFTQSLNGYAANSLGRFERARFDKLFNAEGEQHREFCDIFGPEHILENVDEFLNYFMVSKVMAGGDTLRASGTVMKKLARWLAEHNHVRTEDMALAIEQGADAARNLPAAEKLSALLHDRTVGRHEPHDSDIEGRFSITKVGPGRIWLQDDDDGKDYGPILLPEKATKLCREGWTISGAVRKSGNRCVLVEVFQVYP
ncbi:MAG TPA: hypothetical protein VGG45_13670 [Terracidiphilus sp.]